MFFNDHTYFKKMLNQFAEKYFFTMQLSKIIYKTYFVKFRMSIGLILLQIVLDNTEGKY